MRYQTELFDALISKPIAGSHSIKGELSAVHPMCNDRETNGYHIGRLRKTYYRLPSVGPEEQQNIALTLAAQVSSSVGFNYLPTGGLVLVGEQVAIDPSEGVTAHAATCEVKQAVSIPNAEAVL
jgi:hypothetical protein